jgi:CCR4-NOT transcription complex subunit 1
LLRFIAPFLKAKDLKPASRDLYRGTLRILLVLLHDFPDFLSEYYFSLCDVVPPHCIQLRNIILSAYPIHITLPDPHRAIANDPVFDVGTIPPILSDFSSNLKPGDLRVYLDQYLLGRSNSSFPMTLKNRLLSTPVEDGSETYNLSLMNALVMYIGVSSVAQAKARSGSSLFNPEDHGVVLLKSLAEDLDAEGLLNYLEKPV